MAKQYPAAFINAIAEEGTKDEAIEWLQKTWNECCELREQLKIYRDYAEKMGKILTPDEQTTTRRTLSDNDSFCPHCGHNRDRSSVGSVDHGDFKSCQMCGATWTETENHNLAR